jgi:hypothetical protein
MKKINWKTLLTGAVFFVYGLGLYVNIVADYDLWGYMAFGRLFWEKGLFPYQDVFSYLPTKDPWVYHEWLTGLIFFLVHEHFSATGLQLLRYGMIYAAIALLLATAVKRGGNPLSIFIVLFLTCNALTHGYAPVRAQVFTYLFFALSLYILERYKRDQRPGLLGWLIPIQILWCNLHGGFVAGLGLIGLYAVGEGITHRRVIPYVRIMFLAAAVTLINPYGIDYWTYMVHAITLPRSEITEWISLSAAIQSGKFTHVSFLFIGMLFVTFFLMVRAREKRLTDILVLAVTAYLGFRSIRHTILFFLAFGAYMPMLLSEQAEILKNQLKAGNIMSRVIRPAIVSASLFLILLTFFSFRHFIYSPGLDLKTPPSYYPVRALEWIATHQWEGNILHHFDWGEFLMWRCYPACRIAMDGRYETVYHPDDRKEYFDFLHGREGWQTFLEKHPHDMVLIKSGTRTDLLMRSHPEWELKQEDGLSVMFLRNQGGVGRKRPGSPESIEGRS